MNIKLKTKFFTEKRTQREVAVKLGIPKTRISEFVQGVKEPTDDQKTALADELNCNVEDIF